MAEFTVPDFYLKCELLSALHRSEWRAKGLPLDPDPATLSTTFELSEWAPNPSLFFLGTLDQVKAFFKKSPNLLDGLKGEITGFNHSTFAECSSWDYNKVKEVTEHLNAGFCDTDSMALRISMTAWAALNFIDIIYAEIWQSEYETSLTYQPKTPASKEDQEPKKTGRKEKLPMETFKREIFPNMKLRFPDSKHVAGKKAYCDAVGKQYGVCEKTIRDKFDTCNNTQGETM